MSHEAQSRLPEWVSNPLLRVAAGAVALGGSLAGCGGDDTGDRDPGFTPIPAHTLTVEPTPTNTPFIEATPTPTVEPTATPTPEKKVTVPCKIVPEEFCAGAELIDWEYQGQTYKIIGMRLPPGTPIFAPASGEFAKTQAGAPFTGNYAALKEDPRDLRKPSIVFIGDIQFDNLLTEMVEGGSVIATIGNNNLTNFDRKYNLLFRVNHLNRAGTGFETDIDTLRNLFPDIVDMPASERVVQSTPVQRVVISSFSDNQK